MLQSRITFDLLFDRGISPVKREGKNQNFFSSVVNMKPSGEGFRTIDKSLFSFIVYNNLDVQVFEVGFSSFLFTKSEIYKIESDNSLTLEMTGITEGHKWSCANYEIYALFTNGQKIIQLDINGNFGYSLVVPLGGFLFNYNGQLIIGGLPLSTNNYIPDLLTSEQEGKAFLLWSGIGNINCVPDEDNVTAGFRSVNELGEIFGIGKVNNHVAVFCKRGVTILPSFETSFGRMDISNKGPRDRDSFVSDEEVSFFIDITGMLWVLSKEGKLSPVGFREIFKNVSTKLFYHKGEDELFIRTSSETFVLNKQGLFTLNGLFLGVTDIDGSNRYLVTTTPDQDDASFVTTPLDFKDPGFKIIEEISIGIDTEGLEQDIEVAVYSREVINGPWFLSPFFRFNNENVVKPHIAGCEFKLFFKAFNFDASFISWLTVQYDKIDKRYNRGHSFVDINKEN